MHPQKRAERLIEIGRLAIRECDGDLPGALRALPLPKARALLKRFPSVGDPGADRILLFAGIAARPSIDSNGLRALVRLGFVTEAKSYAQTYKAATAALLAASPDPEWLKRAYGVLREHGKTLCKRSAPICEPCPLDAVCAHRPVTTGM
jgi:endonuclease III